MECPKCKHKSLIGRLVFKRKKGSKNLFCVKCNSEVKVKHRNIIILIIAIGMGILLREPIKLLPLSGSMRALVVGLIAGLFFGILLGTKLFYRIEVVSDSAPK